MPEYPKKQTETIDTATSVTFNPNIPRVTSINGFLLLREGWVKTGNDYEKDGKKLNYNGWQWHLSGVGRVEWMEDLETKNSDTRPE